MAFDNSKKLLARRGARDLALKLRLENVFKPTLKRFFNSLIKAFRLKYSHNNRKEVINVDDYLPEMVGILRPHYRRVMKAFYAVDRKEIKSLEKKDEIESDIEGTMHEYILIHSEHQAKIILRTVKDELDNAIQKYITESVLNHRDPDPQVIADLVYKDFKHKIKGKADIIALTETQIVAEKTKFEEYRAITQSGDPTSELFMKQWVAILDRRVRPWHAAADGQRVAIDEPFIVKGEKLLYPGDSSFGVSVDNIANCRCSSLMVKL